MWKSDRAVPATQNGRVNPIRCRCWNRVRSVNFRVLEVYIYIHENMVSVFPRSRAIGFLISSIEKGACVPFGACIGTVLQVAPPTHPPACPPHPPTPPTHPPTRTSLNKHCVVGTHNKRHHLAPPTNVVWLAFTIHKKPCAENSQSQPPL